LRRNPSLLQPELPGRSPEALRKWQRRMVREHDERPGQLRVLRPSMQHQPRGAIVQQLELLRFLPLLAVPELRRQSRQRLRDRHQLGPEQLRGLWQPLQHDGGKRKLRESDVRVGAVPFPAGQLRSQRGLWVQCEFVERLQQLRDLLSPVPAGGHLQQWLLPLPARIHELRQRMRQLPCAAGEWNLDVQQRESMHRNLQQPESSKPVRQRLRQHANGPEQLRRMRRLVCNDGQVQPDVRLPSGRL